MANENQNTQVVKFNNNKELTAYVSPNLWKYEPTRIMLEEKPELHDKAMLALGYVAARNPQVRNCSIQSIFMTIASSIEYEMFAGVRQECAYIPYGTELQFQPMVNGLIREAVEAGVVTKVDSEVVHQNDHFQYLQGSETKLAYAKNIIADRGKIIAAYCVLKMHDGQEVIEVMTVAQIAKIQSKVRNKHVWKDHWSEMARKTVIKRALKKVVRSDKLAKLIADDNAQERPDYAEVDQAKLDSINKQITDKTGNVTDVINLDSDTIEPEQADNEPDVVVADELQEQVSQTE